LHTQVRSTGYVPSGKATKARAGRTLSGIGIATEKLVLDQLKKGQGETNERLDKLIAAQERTSQLLEWLGGIVAKAPTST
jgi:hypothetical protein